MTKLSIPEATVAKTIAFQRLLVHERYADPINPRGTNPAMFVSTSVTYVELDLNSFAADCHMSLCGTEKVTGSCRFGPEATSLRTSRPAPSAKTQRTMAPSKSGRELGSVHS